jgi:hypothetical protein
VCLSSARVVANQQQQYGQLMLSQMLQLHVLNQKKNQFRGCLSLHETILVEIMRVVAFDMGTRNFAFCVEEIVDPLPEKRPPPRFELDGQAVPEYKSFLEEKIFRNGRLIEVQCIDLKTYCEDRNLKSIYLALTDVLNAFTRLWDTVDVFLIEQQMAYGAHKSNIQALRLAQHCLSYFLTIYGPFRTIQEFSSTHKTRILGCPKDSRRKHRDRKKFAVELVDHILSQRQDPHLQSVRSFPKRDDISDCVLMIQAHKVLSR